VLFDLATSVRGKRISAVELVGSSIDQIERVNPSLNAVVALRAEEALEEAASVDRRVSAGDTLGPLAGIPFLVKDTENTAGMQTTYGSLLFADTQPALRDDLGARRLKAAGAIVLGKTNMPEFAFEGYTDNRLFGPTRNPWGTDWSPGGSSGGSAAALAAGMSPVATASDGGGSIRIPAALCGLVGLKPTMGAIGRDPIPRGWICLVMGRSGARSRMCDCFSRLYQARSQAISWPFRFARFKRIGCRRAPWRCAVLLATAPCQKP
jgi:Asp-tRNA(Asn)/Glu-tRNA(Gln) amidotransferase A subunit family amidase